MSTMTINVSDISLENPAQHLRKVAAAVKVSFTWWGVRRSLTKDQKTEAAQPFGAVGEVLTVSKRLIDTKHEAWKNLMALKGSISEFWKGMTLPFPEPGIRLLKQSDLEMFVRKMTEFKTDLQQAERQLDLAYDEIKEGARRKLGDLFDPTDYPPVIRDLFLVEWEFPSTEPPQYLLQLNPEVYEQERQRVARRFEEAVALAEQSFTQELASMVQHLADRLTPNADGSKKVFRDSAMGNLKEFFQRFRSMSMRSNAALDSIVEQAEHLLDGTTPQDLRDLPGLRSALATHMTEIGQQLESLMVTAPRRRIVLPDQAE